MNTEVYQSPLPSRHAVRSLIEDLVGREVEINDCDALPRRATNVVAVYVDDRTSMSAVIVVDLACAARLGGALGLLPAGGVEDAIDEKDLFDLLRDNCYEVLNVLAAVFNVPNAPHVRLYEMYASDDAVPGDVAGLAYAVGGRMDVVLSIAGYGDGRLSVVIK
jgi:hypothetical protein